MSFAIETVADFTEHSSPIAGRIGEEPTAPESNNQDDDTQVEEQADAETEETLPVAPDDAEVPSDSPAVPESEPAAAVAADADDQWWEEIELIGEMAAIERDRQEAADKLEELTEERKEAKKIHDGLVVQLQQVASKMLALTAGKKLPVKPKAATPESTATAEQPEESFDANAWRMTPTAQLLDGTKGMGKKKLEAIVDLAPTAGDLEDLRAAASQQHKPFKDLLPKGCGQGLADAIEDRLVEHVAKLGTPPAHEQVKENAVQPSAEDDAEDSTEEPDTLDAVVTQIRQAAIAEGWGIDDVEVDQDSDLAATVEGFEAWDAGQPYVTCPYFEAKERRDWVTGWVCGERRKALQEMQPSEDALADL